MGTLAVSMGIMAAGIAIIVVGFSIKKKGKTSFIAGNNEIFVPKNEKKLAGRIGWLVILFGMETFLFPLFFQWISGITGTHFAVLAGFQLLVVFLFMLMDQFEK